MTIAICGHNGFLASLTKRFLISFRYDIVEVNRFDLINVEKLKLKFSFADVVKAWEKSISTNKSFKNYCSIRLGVVLDKRDGYLKSAIQNFRCGIGIYFGRRNSAISFIDSFDLLSAIRFIIEN